MQRPIWILSFSLALAACPAPAESPTVPEPAADPVAAAAPAAAAAADPVAAAAADPVADAVPVAAAAAVPVAAPVAAPAPAAAPAPGVGLGQGGPLLLLGDGAAVHLLSAKGEPLGSLDLRQGIPLGIAHDRRKGDGFWVVLDRAPAGLELLKLDWGGKERARYKADGLALGDSPKVRGLDYVFGLKAPQDLLVVHLRNRRGQEILACVRVADGDGRAAFRFGGGVNFFGLRTESYRPGSAGELAFIEWWAQKADRNLERWSYRRGFLIKEQHIPLAAQLDALFVAPWGQVLGLDQSAGELLWLGSDGKVETRHPAPRGARALSFAL